MRTATTLPCASWRERARAAVGAGLLFAVALAVAYGTRHVDSPAGIVTWSGAFITDEGFHSKWAQNAVRFGTYGDPYDFSFVPAGFIHNVATLLVFRLFGASFEVLRLYAAFLGALALLLYWGLLRAAPPPFSRWMALLLLVTTVNYMAYARVLFIEPLALVFGLAALSLAVRPRVGWGACALSIVLAFGAFLTKIHGVDVVVTVIAMWLLRLVAWREFDGLAARRVGSTLIFSVVFMLGVAAALYLRFQEGVGEFVAATQTQFLGRMSARQIPANEAKAFGGLLQNTHHAAFFVAMLAAFVAFAVRRPRIGAALGAFFRSPVGVLRSRLPDLRAYQLDIAMVLWLVLGILVRGASSYQAPRYFFPLLFPLSYLAVRLLFQAPERYRNGLFLVTLVIQAYVQAPLYGAWLYRKDVGSQYANHVSFAREIETRVPSGRAVLLGGDAAMYSLFGSRIRPIEPEYFPDRYGLCDRIAYWRPSFYVSTGADDAFLSALRKCPGVGPIDEVKREAVFTGKWGDRVLYAINYPR
jgi:hypothetical protein